MPDRIRFHLDEHVDPRIATALRRENIDVTTTVDAGLRACSDQEQLDYAIRNGRVLVTQDEDLLVLASEASHAGIAYCRQNTRTIGQIVEMLVLIHGALTVEEMRNHVEFL
jgi:predicted nuclease of predicted toxin-antitoxin system